MFADALHGGALAASAVATGFLVVRPRRGQGGALVAASLMTAAMADAVLWRRIDPVWWVSAQILVAVLIAVGTRVAAGARRARTSPTTVPETVALLLMAAIMARMSAGATDAAHHHASADGLSTLVTLLFMLYAGVSVHGIRVLRDAGSRVHALLMTGSATMMFVAGWVE